MALVSLATPSLTWGLSTDQSRPGGAGTIIDPMRTFTPDHSTQVLRGICHGARPDIYCLCGNAILALQQFPHILGLPLGDRSDLNAFGALRFGATVRTG